MTLTNLLFGEFWTGATPTVSAAETVGGASTHLGLYAFFDGFAESGAATAKFFNPLIASVGNMMRR